MFSPFAKENLVDLSTTIQALVKNFTPYANELNLPEPLQERWEASTKAASALSSAVNQLQTMFDELNSSCNELSTLYTESNRAAKAKKEMFDELTEIFKAGNVQKVRKEVRELTLALQTRRDEVTCIAQQCSSQLGFSTSEAQKLFPQEYLDDQDEDEVLNKTMIDFFPTPKKTETEQLQQLPSKKRVRIPKMSVPKFSGESENFAEFWAVFSALVDENTDLENIEKIMLLKESLEGKAQKVIAGIQVVPKNYIWMKQTLQTKYSHSSSNRASIVQKLVNLPLAGNSASDCSDTLDEIRALVHQMISTGHDIGQSCDAMWKETIYKKFPYRVLEKILTDNYDKANITIRGLLDQLEKEISSRMHIETHLRPYKDSVKRSPESGEKKYIAAATSKPTAIKSFTTSNSCIFCDRNHASSQCRTVRDISKRRSIVVEKKACWKCFQIGHRSNECSEQNCLLCKGSHHQGLCQKTGNAAPASKSWSNNPAQQQRVQYAHQPKAYTPFPPVHQLNAQVDHPHPGYFPNDQTHPGYSANHAQLEMDNRTPFQAVLMTAEGLVYSHATHQYERIIFFFDIGAQKTVIEEKTAMQLGLPIKGSKELTMSGIGNHRETFTSHTVELNFSTCHGESCKMEVQTKPVLTGGFNSVHLTPRDIGFMREHDIRLATSKVRGETTLPQISIGADFFNVMVLNMHRHHLPSGLVVASTLLGPTAHGRGYLDFSAALVTNHDTVNLTSIVEITEDIMLKEMFELEGVGIGKDEYGGVTGALSYYENYTKSIHVENGIITAPFPVKENISALTSNRPVALSRLRSLCRTLERSPEQKKHYVSTIAKYLEDGVIEEVTCPVNNAAGTYYMPHSGVWRANKPKPLRIVFDASSKVKGAFSLNDVIHTGESFVNKIHDILVTSRKGKIMILADIEAAFTQIRISDNHKDLCRFLWLKDPNLPPHPDNVCEYRWKRLPFGVTASPSILNMSIASFLIGKNTSLANEILANLYVDNIMFMADTEEEAIEKCREAKLMFNEISMNLREFITSSERVNAQIPENDRLPPSNTKFLGVQYSPHADSYTLALPTSCSIPATKRDLLSQLHSVYDPIGAVSPALLELKLILRDVFALNLGWKDPLPCEIRDRWTNAYHEILQILVSIPRCITIKNNNCTLWLFCDASLKATAACIYLQDNETGTISSLISGKSKLTPQNKHHTIPRLEMLAILLGVRLACNVVENLHITETSVHIVSDSTIALSWLTSVRKLPIFVANQVDRVNKLRSELEAKNHIMSFFHVPTTHNPADIGTRGASNQSISTSDWINGPAWLREPPTTWPLTPLDRVQDIALSDVNEELHIDDTIYTQLTQTVHDNPEGLVDLRLFSKFTRASRVLARALKVLVHWCALTNKNRNTNIALGAISDFGLTERVTVRDMQHSETLLLCFEHKHISLEELQQRHRGKPIVRDDNGILRYASRLQNADISFDTRNPIVVVNTSELARVLITEAHENNSHCGRDHTLTILRQRFWILKPSSTVKKILNRCGTCKKHNGFPFEAPAMPSLPKDRVNITKPFLNTGVDFAGPYSDKNDSKYYICLFTCLTTRAVHLEVAETLSGGAFLNAFIRFSSRRGIPTVVRSDCGSNFVLGEKIINSLSEPDDSSGISTMSYCADNRITWLFNPPGAAWMGGAWEKLVGSVKRALTKTIGRKRITIWEMNTTLARIEAIINTRPLTTLDVTDITVFPLRPIDFLQGNLKYSIGNTDHEYDPADPAYDPTLIQSVHQAREAINYSEQLANHFWSRFMGEYLPTLREIHKHTLKQPRTTNRSVPEVGEIVLVENDMLPRGSWSLGKITEIITSRDNNIRSAKFITSSGRVSHRPLNKLYPLEIRACEPVSTPPSSDSSVPVAPRQQPSRAAKSVALAKLQQTATSPDDNDTPIPAPRASKVSTTALLITALCMITPAMAIPESSVISCDNGRVTIHPQPHEHRVCFDNDCRSFPYNHEPSHYLLPPSTGTTTTVSVQSPQNSTSKLCANSDYCQFSQSIMSRNLIGNPQCWPVGAIISIGIVFYILLLIAVVLCCVLRRKWSNDGVTVNVQQHNSPQNNIQINDSEAFRLSSLRVPSIPTASALQIMSIALIFTCVLPCQHSYSRMSIDLVCHQRNKCEYQYNKEFIFNRIHREACIDLRHENTTVGQIRIVKLPTQSQCIPVVRHYTRHTLPKVFTAHNCFFQNDCSYGCEHDGVNSIPPSLNHTRTYPGYSVCTRSCGALFCGCVMPFQSCTHFRIAHVPQTEIVYSVIQCSDWKPKVRFQIESTLYGQHTVQSISADPYIKLSLDSVNMTIITHTKPQYPIMHRRFAVSQSEVLVIPDNYVFPIECPTAEDAEMNVANCTNKMLCTCYPQYKNMTCQCPNEDLAELRSNLDNVLPIQTPFLQFTAENDSIYMFTIDEETVVAINSHNTPNMATHVSDKPCTVKPGLLTGCYNCEPGGRTSVTCTMDDHAWVTIECPHQIFSVPCAPAGAVTNLTFAFQGALIEETCHTVCGGGVVTFKIDGHLRYEAQIFKVSVFDTLDNTTAYTTSWFDDWNTPDLTPLGMVLASRWKTTLAVLGVASALVGLSVLLGPATTAKLIHLIMTFIRSLVSLAISAARSLVGHCYNVARETMRPAARPSGQ